MRLINGGFFWFNMEVWKEIKGYQGDYEISDLGRVKSFKRKGKPKILINILVNNGYSSVGLSLKGKAKIRSVHQLVAMAFLGHVPCGFKKVIDHKNNIKTDNRADNLQIVSNRFNTTKNKKKGTSKYIGVSWAKGKQRWRVSIRINGKNKHLGYLKNEYDAHLKYQEELKNIIN